jgi:hypothetical protein
MIVRQQAIVSYTPHWIKLSRRVTRPTQVPLPDNTNTHKREISMSPVRFETAVPATEGRRHTT